MKSKRTTLAHILASLFKKKSSPKKIKYIRSKDFEFAVLKKPYLNHFSQIESAAKPFKIIVNEERNQESVLLIHGLSDSPYYMKDIALSMAENGFNVVAITLSGHTTTPASLSAARFEDWLEDLEFGIGEAKKYGSKVSLVGMSTGGTLITRALLDSKIKQGIHKAMLVSPALKLIGRAEILCWRVMEGGYRGWKEHGRGVRYKKIANEGVCALCKLNESINKKILEGERIETPISSFFADSDLTVDIFRSNEILEKTADNYIGILLGGGEEDRAELMPNSLHLYAGETFGHVTPLLRKQGFAGNHEVNPNYSVFERNFIDFFKSN